MENTSPWQRLLPSPTKPTPRVRNRRGSRLEDASGRRVLRTVQRDEEAERPGEALPDPNWT